MPIQLLSRLRLTSFSFWCGVLLLLHPRLATAQGTAFTYQGRLTTGTTAANGSYDLRFSLFDNLTNGVQQGSSLTNAATGVSNGLFTVTLDFGGQFPGLARWLEIGVRTNGSSAFTTLSPRQRLTPTPYAIYAANAGSATSANGVAAANITGTLTAPQLPATLVTNGGSFTGVVNATGGNVLTNLPAGNKVFCVAPWGNPTNTGSYNAPLDSDYSVMALLSTNAFAAPVWIYHYPGATYTITTQAVSYIGTINIYNYGATIYGDALNAGSRTGLFQIGNQIGPAHNTTFYPASLNLYGGTISNDVTANTPLFSFGISGNYYGNGTNNYLGLHDCSLYNFADGFFHPGTNIFIFLDHVYWTSPEDMVLVNGASGKIYHSTLIGGQQNTVEITGGVWDIQNSEIIYQPGKYTNTAGAAIRIVDATVNLSGGYAFTPYNSTNIAIVTGTTGSTVTFESLPCSATGIQVFGTNNTINFPNYTSSLFTGNGTGLTNINGRSVTGMVAQASNALQANYAVQAGSTTNYTGPILSSQLPGVTTNVQIYGITLHVTNGLILRITTP